MVRHRLVLILLWVCAYETSTEIVNSKSSMVAKQKYGVRDQFGDITLAEGSGKASKGSEISANYDYNDGNNNNNENVGENFIEVNESPTESINYPNKFGEIEQVSTTEIPSMGSVDDNLVKRITDSIQFNPTVIPSAIIPITTYERTTQNELANYHRQLIDYISHLFCYDGSYQYIHIYVERSLTTPLADALIMRLNGCMAAGVLTSR